VLQRLRAMRTNESGFTLVELLIVIVILGILTGIVVFAVGGFSDRGQSAACKTDRKTIEVAVEAYRAKVGNYPTAGSSALNYGLLISGGYLREAPSIANYTIDLADGGVITVTTPPAGGC
jgi:prepilin-type N-terminal cleavage/methylation domain-containing protein